MTFSHDIIALPKARRSRRHCKTTLAAESFRGKEGNSTNRLKRKHRRWLPPPSRLRQLHKGPGDFLFMCLFARAYHFSHRHIATQYSFQRIPTSFSFAADWLRSVATPTADFKNHPVSDIAQVSRCSTGKNLCDCRFSTSVLVPAPLSAAGVIAPPFFFYIVASRRYYHHHHHHNHRHLLYPKTSFGVLYKAEGAIVNNDHNTVVILTMVIEPVIGGEQFTNEAP